MTVGKRPWSIALSPDAKTLYSANGPSNNISVVHLADNTVVATIPARTEPWGVIVLPAIASLAVTDMKIETSPKVVPIGI